MVRNGRVLRSLKVALALALLGIGILNVASASNPALEMDQAVVQAANEFMASPRAVGLSLGVIHEGKAYSYHFGRVNKDSARSPDGQTIYPIASLTKTFTGLLLAQATLEKKLAPDDDVRQYLGSGYDNLVYEQQPVRLYHLLNHRSGLPFVLPNKPEASPDFKDSTVPFPLRVDAIVANSSRDEFYADLRKVRLNHPPGTRFQYSNAAAQLLGYILENSYGKRFDDLAKEKIAKPLAMRDLTITLSPEQQSRLARGYDENGLPQAYWSNQFQAAGALKATLDDMLLYAKLQLAERDAAVRLSHQPSYQSDNYSVGLNWQMLTEGGRRVIWQDGAIPGFASLLVLQPEANTAVVLLSNELDSETLGRLRLLANTITRNLDQQSLAVP